MYAKCHGDGNDITDRYEAFNRTYWHDDRYATYLFWNYGVTDDDLINSAETTHHLPDTRTQQYYEMTGKYDQFAWGWDDAVRGWWPRGAWGSGGRFLPGRRILQQGLASGRRTEVSPHACREGVRDRERVREMMRH